MDVTADVPNVDYLRNHASSAKNGIAVASVQFQIRMNVFAIMMKSISIAHHVSDHFEYLLRSICACVITFF